MCGGLHCNTEDDDDDDDDDDDVDVCYDDDGCAAGWLATLRAGVERKTENRIGSSAASASKDLL